MKIKKPEIIKIIATSLFFAACSASSQTVIHAEIGKICEFPIKEEIPFPKNKLDKIALEKLGNHIDSLVKISCPYDIAEIHGYTDTNGDADENMEISRQRAVSVQQWLGQEGYWADTAKIIAHGENDLFIQSDYPLYNDLNNRVVVVITGVSAGGN